MADFLTHLVSALLPAALCRRVPVGPFALGAVLPDLGSRVPSLALEALRRGGVSVPEVLSHPFSVFHTPLGGIAAVILISSAVVEEQRRRARRWMLAGLGLHWALDLVQNHYGNGYMLLFPFSTWDWELGWVGAEATVPYAPALALVTALAWAWRLRRRTVSA